MTWTDASAAPKDNGGKLLQLPPDRARRRSRSAPSARVCGTTASCAASNDAADPASLPVVQYTWGKLWNSKAYVACSNMPRFGHMGLLDENQLRNRDGAAAGSEVAGQPVRRARPRPAAWSAGGVMWREPDQARVRSGAGGGRGAAGMALGRWTDADAASAQATRWYDMPPPSGDPVRCRCCTSPIATRSSSRIAFASRASTSASAIMRGQLAAPAWARRCCKALRHCARHRRWRMPSRTSTSTQASRRYGKVGGFAHLATLVKRLKASRPGALLLDGGDTWQGSATALWTQRPGHGRGASSLGVDVTTGHWEFTYGMDARQADRRERLQGPHRVRRAERQDRRLRRPGVQALCDARDQRRAGRDHRPGVPVHADRQPALLRGRLDLRHPGRAAAEGWSTRCARKGAQVGRAAVAQRHGRAISKLASRVRGIDAILGGHTHDGVPVAGAGRRTRGGTTLVTNAGSNGKFLGVLDFDVRERPRAPTSATGCCRCSRTCCRADAAMEALHRAGARAATRRSSTRRSRSPTACSTAAATSTARWDQLICRRADGGARAPRSRSRRASAGAPRCCRARRSRAS